ncbi:hypothetical protein [Streptomyces sp. NBC_00083]|uniref:hypothetical protein n=1 Tax=Streptomyces sp. NBC_00083 TaxID=2975647 RepID=UPI00224E913F|nr:hypothetical protein [Streptomyces sp. NBC_00083]MCX5387399.1 hypothetical protein [Streptomyces sp. NBC_00083]
MSSEPIVVHRIQGEGGRRVTVRGRIQGIVYSDSDLIEVLRIVGVTDPESTVASSSPLLEWRDAPPHDYGLGPGEAAPRPAPRR